MTGHFFSLNNWKRVFKFVRDTLEALEIVRTTFKPVLISLLQCSAYIQFLQSIEFLLIGIES